MGFGDIKKKTRKLFIKDLANEVKLFDTINKNGKNIPYKIDKKTEIMNGNKQLECCPASKDTKEIMQLLKKLKVIFLLQK